MTHIPRKFAQFQRQASTNQWSSAHDTNQSQRRLYFPVTSAYNCLYLKDFFVGHTAICF